LKKTVQEAQKSITSSEFLEWMEFLECEEQRHTKEDYYSALIASEIRRSWVKDAYKVKTDSFLIKWVKKKMKVNKTKEDITMQHKLFWGVVLANPMSKNKRAGK